ncbi:tyrosine-type recombinase/integrase [Nocardioides dokdonensis]|uniref:tyrosine-type recombinase/integrase n=1 Tax=Nocardioides dokdonensis TaxID=450734 RepID=UPI003AAE9D80
MNLWWLSVLTSSCISAGCRRSAATNRPRSRAGGVCPPSASLCRVPDARLSHLQFEALLSAARKSSNVDDFALVTLLGLLGLRIFEATGANIEALEEVHGHRVLRILGKGDKVALVPLPPAVGRATERAVGGRFSGPILRSRTGSRMDRHCATRRLRALAECASVSTARMHPHMLRHTFVTTTLDGGEDLRDVQIAARHADQGPPCATTELARIWTDTLTTSSPPIWPLGRRPGARYAAGACVFERTLRGRSG